MYPTISDLLFDLLGVRIPLPVQSFGFMLAIAFLLGAWTLSLELKRKENEGLIFSRKIKVLVGKKASITELLSAGVIWFLIGYKVSYAMIHYTEFVADTQGMLLSSVGYIWGGLLFGGFSAFLRYREKEKNKLPQPVWKEEVIHPFHLVGNITIIAAIGGIIGAKIFHNLENLDEFFADPAGSLMSFSGLTMYGGLIVGAFSVLWYGKKNGIPLLHLCDAAAPGLMLSYGVGRIGCQISGDGDWGIVNNTPNPFSFLPDWMWSYNYPHNVNSVGIPIPGCEGSHCMMLPESVYPTPFYEAVMCVLLFGVLWKLRKRIVIPGILFLVYLVLNGFERFWIEKIRVNTKYHIFGNEITQAEIISTLLVIGGIAGIYYLRKKTGQNASQPDG
jgi:phosphatidylglycerol---prolipoprotein diacylglyceryl transferase